MKALYSVCKQKEEEATSLAHYFHHFACNCERAQQAALALSVYRSMRCLCKIFGSASTLNALLLNYPKHCEPRCVPLAAVCQALAHLLRSVVPSLLDLRMPLTTGIIAILILGSGLRRFQLIHRYACLKKYWLARSHLREMELHLICRWEGLHARSLLNCMRTRCAATAGDVSLERWVDQVLQSAIREVSLTNECRAPARSHPGSSTQLPDVSDSDSDA